MVLSLFPSLLSWSQVSPLLIRLTLGLIFIFWAYRHFISKKPAHADIANSSTFNNIFAGIEGIVGILLVIGLWTQGAAIVAIIDLIVRLVERAMKKAFLSDGVNYYLILLVLAISLLITGAGIWAIDFAGL